MSVSGSRPGLPVQLAESGLRSSGLPAGGTLAEARGGRMKICIFVEALAVSQGHLFVSEDCRCMVD